MAQINFKLIEKAIKEGNHPFASKLSYFVKTKFLEFVVLI